VITAGDLYDLRLQRGRLLRGWPLAVACALRNLALGFLLDDDVDVAPGWVVVTDRRSGARVGLVAVGRDAFAGDATLAAMTYDAAFLAPEQFVKRHGVR